MAKQTKISEAFKTVASKKNIAFVLVIIISINSFAQSSNILDYHSEKLSNLIISTKKKNIGVTYFVNDNNQATKFGKYICQQIIAGLVNTDSNLMYNVKEMALSKNNDYCSNLLGIDSKVDLIIKGAITQIGEKYNITITLVEITTCNTLKAYTISDLPSKDYNSLHNSIIGFQENSIATNSIGSTFKITNTAVPQLNYSIPTNQNYSIPSDMPPVSIPKPVIIEIKNNNYDNRNILVPIDGSIIMPGVFKQNFVPQSSPPPYFPR